MTNGYSRELIDHFQDGFPEDWMEIMEDFFRRERDGEVAEDDKTAARRTIKPAVVQKKPPPLVEEDESEEDDAEDDVEVPSPPQQKRRRSSKATPTSATRLKKSNIRTPTNTTLDDAMSTISTRTRRRSAAAHSEVSFKLEWGTGRVKPAPAEKRSPAKKQPKLTVKNVEDEISDDDESEEDIDPAEAASSDKEESEPEVSSSEEEEPVRPSPPRPKKTPKSTSSNKKSAPAQRRTTPATTKGTPKRSKKQKSIRDVDKHGWSLKEDRLLQMALLDNDLHGDDFWDQVTNYLPDRTVEECRERYSNNFGGRGPPARWQKQDGQNQGDAKATPRRLSRKRQPSEHEFEADDDHDDEQVLERRTSPRKRAKTTTPRSSVKSKSDVTTEGEEE